MHYNRVTSTIIEQIKEIVGKESVLLPIDDIEPYTHDETEDLKFLPEIVVKPKSTEEISEIMKLCNEHLIPVTPRGGGTGLSGGALAVHGGIILSIERMNRILEIDKENLMAVVEAGVITQTLQEEVEKYGLFYPPDLGSRGSCMISGNIAECAGGTRAVKYGVTKDFVYGLEAVLPNGEIINTGGKLIKNMTGFNLTQLLVGSEGTLAIITKAILRLIPLPRYRRTILVPFSDIQSAAKSVTKIFHSKITPRAVEFMEQSAIKAVEQKQNIKFPHSEAEALLLIDIDGNDEKSLESDIEKIGEICMAEGAPDIFLATDSEKQKFLWDARHEMGRAIKSLSVYKEEDVVVPRSHLPELMKYIKEICDKYGVKGICYGHAGDGNIHLNILKSEMPKEKWEKDLPKAITELYKKVVDMGGMISGEHGIGYTRKNYLSIALGETEIELMRQIKRVFDPNNVLNPGKIFPDNF